MLSSRKAMDIPFISHVLNGRVWGTDEDYSGLGTFSCKCGVLAQL
jgi:hypothetical protein